MLYEVITGSMDIGFEADNGDVDWYYWDNTEEAGGWMEYIWTDSKQNDSMEFMPYEAYSRITSYNVCYTKLLRIRSICCICLYLRYKSQKSQCKYRTDNQFHCFFH